MRNVVKAIVAVLPVLALAGFAVLQQSNTTVQATSLPQGLPGIHATPVVSRT